jgi:hypothetical protein
MYETVAVSEATSAFSILSRISSTELDCAGIHDETNASKKPIAN